MNKILKDNVVNVINESGNFDYKVNNDLQINFFNDNTSDLNINIIQDDNSTLVLNMTLINYNSSNVIINTMMNGSNNKCVINMRVIGEKNNCHIKVISKAIKDTKNNQIIQNLKGINEEGTIIIEPILEVDTKDIEASHFVTIGSYSKEDIFYLNSLNICTTDAKKLLKNGFIYSIFSDNCLNLLNERR